MNFLKFILLLAFMVILDYHGNAQCKRTGLSEKSAKVEVKANKILSIKDAFVSTVPAQPDCQMSKSFNPLICPPRCQTICSRYVLQLKDLAQFRLTADLAEITAQSLQSTTRKPSPLMGFNGKHNR